MKIKETEPGSIADEIGLSPGDEILSINGNRIQDTIDYQFYIYESEVTVGAKLNGEISELDIEKDPEEDEVYLPPNKRKQLLALYKQSGVIAVLAGHTHRTIINNYEGIQLVNGETTSMNFDKRPLGFRLWTVASPKSAKHEFVPLKPKDVGQKTKADAGDAAEKAQ